MNTQKGTSGKAIYDLKLQLGEEQQNLKAKLEGKKKLLRIWSKKNSVCRKHIGVLKMGVVKEMKNKISEETQLQWLKFKEIHKDQTLEGLLEMC